MNRCYQPNKEYERELADKLSRHTLTEWINAYLKFKAENEALKTALLDTEEKLTTARAALETIVNDLPGNSGWIAAWDCLERIGR